MENNAEDDDISAQTPPEQCRAHFAHPNCTTIQISTLRVRFTKSNKHMCTYVSYGSSSLLYIM